MAEQDIVAGAVLDALLGNGGASRDNRPRGRTMTDQQPPLPSRDEAFDAQVASYLARGWRIESRTEHSAVMVKGKPVNHILHLLLTLVTVGLWLPVWIFLTVARGEKHQHIAG
jgi:hypothetical protein